MGPVEVEVVTFQSRYCEGSAGAEVEREGMHATVTPFVRTVAGPNCPDAGAFRTIRATVMFPRPGRATVTFNVRVDPPDPPPNLKFEVEIR